MMEGLDTLHFRPDADKHLVVVTKSKLKTSWGLGDQKKSGYREDPGSV